MKRKQRKAFEKALLSGAIKPAQMEVKGKVTAYKLNVRQKPKLSSRVVAQVHRNDIVLIANSSDKWYQIVYNDKTAYVYKKYISILSRFTKGKIIANILNVRKQPNSDSKIVGKLHNGEIVDILKEYSQWHKIDYKGTAAFVFKKLVDTNYEIEPEEEKIKPEKEEEPIKKEDEPKKVKIKGKITANSLNIREQFNSDSKIVGKFNKGEIITIIKKYDKWYKIDYKGEDAYIYAKYVNTNYKNDPPSGTTKYFYQREDLAQVKLEPKKTISVPSDRKEKIAANTWNKYGGLIQVISDELKFEVESALAVLCVESGGNGYANDRMIIRFENHVMDIYWGKKGHEKEFADYFDYDRKSRRHEHKFRTSKRSDWEKCHTSQDMEWKVFEHAKTLAEREAIYSISMGAPQVMGFNYKSIGYSSPQEMFEFFQKDIRYHLLALFDFCQYRPQRVEYLQKKDFYSFSREYNGSSAPAQYEKRIKEYYDIFKKLL